MGEQLYDYSVDYTDKIKKAEEDGNYLLAAEYEKIRNQKIDDQKLDYDKTYKYQYDTPVTTIGDTNYYKTGTGYDDVDKDGNPVYDAGDLNLYVTTKPSELANSAAAGGSGSSGSAVSPSSGGYSYDSGSYASQYDSKLGKLLEQYLGRDAFSYDYTEDPVYRQYADQYTTLGNQAMQDTLGQVSARTGGLASSYAGSASQGAYNSYMQQLAAKVPELYQLAYSMYQNEGDRELQNLNLLRGLQSDDRSQYNTDRSFNYGVYSDSRDFAAREAQQTKENTWYEEQVARGVNENALQAAMSNGLSQAQWEAQKAQYQKTGKGGAEVANYETYFDYMTGLTDYYAERLR